MFLSVQTDRRCGAILVPLTITFAFGPGEDVCFQNGHPGKCTRVMIDEKGRKLIEVEQEGPEFESSDRKVSIPLSGTANVGSNYRATGRVIKVKSFHEEAELRKP